MKWTSKRLSLLDKDENTYVPIDLHELELRGIEAIISWDETFAHSWRAKVFDRASDYGCRAQFDSLEEAIQFCEKKVYRVILENIQRANLQSDFLKKSIKEEDLIVLLTDDEFIDVHKELTELMRKDNVDLG